MSPTEHRRKQRRTAVSDSDSDSDSNGPVMVIQPQEKNGAVAAQGAQQGLREGTRYQTLPDSRGWSFKLEQGWLTAPSIVSSSSPTPPPPPPPKSTRTSLSTEASCIRMNDLPRAKNRLVHHASWIMQRSATRFELKREIPTLRVPWDDTWDLANSTPRRKSRRISPSRR